MEKKLVFGNEALKLVKEVDSLLQKHQELFFDFNIEDATELAKRYKNLNANFEKILEKIKSAQQTRALIYLHSAVNRLSELLNNQLAIDL